MKKILYVCSEFAPGMLSFAATIINSVALSGEFDVYVVAVSNGELSYRKILHQVPVENLTFIEYPKHKIHKLFYKVLPVKLWKSIKKVCKKNGIKKIHLLTGDFFLVAYCNKLNRKYELYYTVHDLFPHESLLNNYKRKLIYWMVKNATNYYIQKTQNLVSSSREQYDFLKKMYPSKNVKFHGFPSLITKEITAGKGYCPELNGIKGYVLFFGHLDIYKGVELLYNVFTKYPDFKEQILVIAGKDAGKDEYYFPRNSSDDSNIIRINRYIKDEEVKSLFENACCVVYPYISATQTGAMTLAYEFGIPMVVSDIPYFKDNVIDGKTGILFRRNDEVDLSKALKKALFEIDRMEMSKEQKCYFETNFSTQKLVTDLKQIYGY